MNIDTWRKKANQVCPSKKERDSKCHNPDNESCNPESCPIYSKVNNLEYPEVKCPRCKTEFQAGKNIDGDYECDEHYKPYFFTIENGIVVKNGFAESEQEIKEKLK